MKKIILFLIFGLILLQDSSAYLFRTVAADGQVFANNNTYLFLDGTKITVDGNSKIGNPAANFDVSPNGVHEVTYELPGYITDTDDIYFDINLPNCDQLGCTLESNNFKTVCQYNQSFVDFTCTTTDLITNQYMVFIYNKNDQNFGEVIRIVNGLFKEVPVTTTTSTSTTTTTTSTTTSSTTTSTTTSSTTSTTSTSTTSTTSSTSTTQPSSGGGGSSRFVRSFFIGKVLINNNQPVLPGSQVPITIELRKEKSHEIKDIILTLSIDELAITTSLKTNLKANSEEKTVNLKLPNNVSPGIYKLTITGETPDFQDSKSVGMEVVKVRAQVKLLVNDSGLSTMTGKAIKDSNAQFFILSNLLILGIVIFILILIYIIIKL